MISMATLSLECGLRPTATPPCGGTRSTTGRKGACAYLTVGVVSWKITTYLTIPCLVGNIVHVQYENIIVSVRVKYHMTIKCHVATYFNIT